MSISPRLSLLIVLLVGIGCNRSPYSPGDEDTDTDNGIDTAAIGSVICTPGHTLLTIDDGTAKTVQLTAEHYTDEGPVEIGAAKWVIVSGPGHITPTGLYTSPAEHGGQAVVEVSYEGESDVCVVDVEHFSWVNPSGDGSVPGAFDEATPEVDDTCAAPLLYPLADSGMPGSFLAPLLQWNHAGHNMHKLSITSDFTTLVVYTSDNRFQPTQAQWWGLTAFSEDNLVEVTLTSGSWNGSSFTSGPCTATAPTRFEVADSSIDGTIVYWAPPLTKALTFEATSTEASVSNVPLPAMTCHGCHTVNLARPSRMTYGPDMPGTTNLVDLDSPSTLLNTWGDMMNMRDYAAPDPSGGLVVISGMSLLGGSSMNLYSQSTGADLGTISTSRAPTMPNWSPDGTLLVYAGCDSGASALSGSRCNLYTQTFNPDTQTFSGETMIAEAPANHTLYYPTFSPDSKWVAYNIAEQWTDAEGNNHVSNNNPRAKVALVSATGGPQMVLDNANGVGDLTNSWPRWAPSAGTYAWLAYSTKRAYGHQVEGTAQLWVTAIDLDAAADGADDPSLAPSWIPGQLLSEGNHTPTWLPRFNF